MDAGIRAMIKRSKELYASKHMRHQWVRKTLALREAGKHVLLLGRFPGNSWNDVEVLR